MNSRKKAHAKRAPHRGKAGAAASHHSLPSIRSHHMLRLPNGIEIACQTATEARFLYTDIFERQAYCTHGVTLQGARCVFDVGANIGLFTLFVGRHCPQATVYSFEPAPALFEILKFNVERFGTRARLFNHGIAEAARTAQLTFYPNSSAMSSFYGDAEEERRALHALMLNELEDGKPGMEEVIEHAGDLLEERLRCCSYQCRLLPLSDVIRNCKVKHIDLLKVDVQKSELDVIRGIDEEHWPLIRQLVLELHNTDDQLSWLSSYLQEREFKVVACQDEHYRGSVMFNVFATRPDRQAVSRFALPGGFQADSAGPGKQDAALGETVQEAKSLDGRPMHLLLLSARSSSGLEALGNSLSRWLDGNKDLELAEVAYSFSAGRRQFEHRQMLICRDSEEASAALAQQDPRRLLSGRAPAGPPQLAFMFPGLGDHYRGMASEIYRCERLFRQQVDYCAGALEPHLGLDLRQLLCPPRSPGGDSAPAGLDFRRMVRGSSRESRSSGQLIRTRLAQPVLFALEYALARQWMAWGLQPQAMIGYSIGEYVAACLAGVFSLPDALMLVARRAQLIDALPDGSMLAVPLSENQARPLLGQELSLAAVNSSSACIVAGPKPVIAEFEKKLAGDGLSCRYLATNHAFHSRMMQPIYDSFTRLVQQVPLCEPRIPFLSNVTGDWITARQATDPEYWARHLCCAVRFADGLSRLLAEENRALLEVGPGQALSAWALQHPWKNGTALAIASLPHALDSQSDYRVLLSALGKLWLAGARVDWESFYAGVKCRRVALPAGLDEDGACPDDAAASGDFPAGPGAPVRSQAPQDLPSGRIRAPYVEPRSELEETLCTLWQDLLGLERVGIHDRFFEIGGDSLKAARLLGLLAEECGVSLPMRRLFRGPTVAELAVAIVQEQAGQVDSDLLAQALAEIRQAGDSGQPTALEGAQPQSAADQDGTAP